MHQQQYNTERARARGSRKFFRAGELRVCIQCAHSNIRLPLRARGGNNSAFALAGSFFGLQVLWGIRKSCVGTAERALGVLQLFNCLVLKFTMFYAARASGLVLRSIISWQKLKKKLARSWPISEVFFFLFYSQLLANVFGYRNWLYPVPFICSNY